ncbi:Glutamate receptor, ionotropic kainate 1 [Melipona quadrifasciata]|uniref:Glutamate receptor, ionotropic kainate 1 n=1 Tax=Melipona quadrifasciata TaxID=166423 RepID=A0A0N0BEK9_9HYME|nr:Glutamate receptor, ionotropic kainate 1 [Melipona quadrifasciata]
MKGFRLPRSISQPQASGLQIATDCRKDRAASRLLTPLLREAKIFLTTKDDRAIFTHDQKDSSTELAFKYAVYKINKERLILPKTTLEYDIQYVPKDDSFHASKKAIPNLFCQPKSLTYDYLCEILVGPWPQASKRSFDFGHFLMAPAAAPPRNLQIMELAANLKAEFVAEIKLSPISPGIQEGRKLRERRKEEQGEFVEFIERGNRRLADSETTESTHSETDEKYWKQITKTRGRWTSTGHRVSFPWTCPTLVGSPFNSLNEAANAGLSFDVANSPGQPPTATGQPRSIRFTYDRGIQSID